MLERFRPQEAPDAQIDSLVDTLVISGNTTGAGEDLKLDNSSRNAALAAGLLLGAGLSKRVIMRSASLEGLKKMEDYMDGMDMPRNAIVARRKPETIAEDVKDLARIVDKKEFGQIGILSPGKIDEKIEKALQKAGISLESIVPEEEIGKRIVDSAGDSRHAVTELLKEMLLNVFRFRNVLVDVKIDRALRAHA